MAVYSDEAKVLQLYFSKHKAIKISIYLVLHGFRIRIQKAKGFRQVGFAFLTLPDLLNMAVFD